MKRTGWSFPLFIGLLMLASLACTVPFLGETGGGNEPTPTPPGDTISFTIPAYNVGIPAGSSVPGTRLEYIGRNGDGFDVRIDGLPAVKYTGDSFIWNGILAPGVFGDYNLRLATVIFSEMQVAGPVKLTILNPTPVERTDNNELQAKLHFSPALTTYYVPVGHAVPGTSVIYDGLRAPAQGEQDSRLGAFTGLSGYPYLAAGDLLSWQGFLRDNVVVDYKLRVISVSAEGVRFGGSADIWLLP
ncbi:MAG: hypothetical protein AAF614_10735 [Chloroflexota bacterium]